MDARTGEMFFHGYTVAPAGADEALQKVGRVGRGNALEALFKLNVTGPCISHDVALTENFLVVFDHSGRFTPQEIVQGKQVFSFDPAFNGRLALVPRGARSGEEARWFEAAQPFLVVHPLHAWEEGSEVVIWAPLGSATPEGERRGAEEVFNGGGDRMRMSELRVDTGSGRVTVREIDGELNSEFCKIRDDLAGQPGVPSPSPLNTHRKRGGRAWAARRD